MSRPVRLLPLLFVAWLTACDPFTATAPSPADGAAVGVVAIGTVQGHGARSPLVGREATVEGVVTGNFGRHLGGWFLQDDGDGDPATSDALFVLAEGDTQVRSGDRVRVRGRVLEHGNGDATLTALAPVAVEPLGRGESPAALVFTEPPDDWEPFEGMRVRIDAPLTISGHHELARRGVLVASFGGRLYGPTEIAEPGNAAAAVAADNARRTLLLDDARADEHPDRIWYLPDHAQAPRAGSAIAGAEGILDQRFGRYRLQLTAPPRLQAATRPPPPQVDGDMRLAAFNLENLFNGDGRGGGFPTERGARTPAELQAQLARLRATITALDPDVAALMELENDGYGPHSSIAELVATLNGDDGDWRFVDSGQGPGDDAIRVGLIYRATRVRPAGPPAVLTGGPFGRRSRVPLAQTFVAVARGVDAGPPFTVVANHFKSKNCGEARGADRDQGDGQACWNATRSESARRLLHWLESDPTQSGSDLVAIVGDLNAYAMEDPVRLLRRAGWRDAFEATERPYGYVYDGQAGRLDHALLSPALAARLAGAEKWHSNADEPANVGYRAVNAGESAAPWRSSDHDPLLLGLRLRAR